MAQFGLLRRIRAQLPYRVKNWKARAQSYWRWDEEAAALAARSVRQSTPTSASTDEKWNSIVWLAMPSQEDICLDLGCGIGRVEMFLAHLVRQVHAVDFSEAMISIARERLAGIPNVHLYLNDGETLGMFPDEMFDLGWAELVFHHVPIEITSQYLREIARVLKPGGRFVCQLPLKEFYDEQSRDICGWLTLSQAERLVKPLFSQTKVWQNSRHILVHVVK